MLAKLKSVGTVLIGLLIMALVLCAVAMLIGGVTWVSEKLLPWFAEASVFAFCALFLLVPISFFRPTRMFASTAIYCLSFLFGAAAWMEGLILTQALWGTGFMIFGLLMGGVGVVPMGILAALFHAEWARFFELIVLIILTFGCRFYGALAIAKAEEAVSQASAKSVYLDVPPAFEEEEL